MAGKSALISWGILLVGGGLMAAVWLNARPAPPEGGMTGAALLRPDDTRLVARGEEIYARACAMCHGANLEGQPGWRTTRGLAPAHDASGHTWHHPDSLLVQITRDGTQRMGGTMPPFGQALSEEDIIAVLSFIKSRWPEQIRKAHDRINAQAGGG